MNYWIKMEDINIIIADKNMQNIIYLINKINSKENYKSYVATTNAELLKIISQNQIDGILCNKNFEIKNSIISIINIPIFYIKKDNIEDIEIDTCLSQINKKVLIESDLKKKIMNQLLLIGYNLKLKGTMYLLESILYICKRKQIELVDNLEHNVYKYVADINGKTVTNIKTNIIKSTNYVYKYQKEKILYEYFSSDIKITPKLVISTVVNKLFL